MNINKLIFNKNKASVCQKKKILIYRKEELLKINPKRK